MPDAMNTPMMRQYLKIKQDHPGSVLLFRMGDFYETFLEDAKKVSSILGITLTARQKNSETGKGIPLAGFPHHALDGYLTKLVKAGCRVAICEQTEDPAKASGLVKRGVVEIVTPGTLISGSALEERSQALLASVSTIGGRSGMVICDMSTGDIRATSVVEKMLTEELARQNPREVLLAENQVIEIPDGCEPTCLEPWKFDPEGGRRETEHAFGLAAPEGFGIEGMPEVLSAMGALLTYIGHTKPSGASHLEFRGLYSQTDSLIMDRGSSRSLGVIDAPPGEEEAVLALRTDETVTPGGGRLWRNWLNSPPLDRQRIEERHTAVEDLLISGNHHRLRTLLGEVSDLERQGGKLGTLRSGPRDLKAIEKTARLLPEITGILFESGSALLARLASTDQLEDVADRIGRTLADDPPARIADGGFVRRGFSAELDALRDLKTGGRRWMEEMVASEQASTGIGRMNLGYNRVFGYYIEVPRSFAELVPEHYIRKQTLVGSERYITPELKDMEQKILRADEETAELEGEIYRRLLSDTAEALQRIKEAGRALSITDTLCSLAYTAGKRGWTKPEISDRPGLLIEDGKHPVLEDLLPQGECVPNTVELSPERRILLVTGPNMAGKSTYLRQAALLVILAQSGSFVPASRMVFSPVDRIYTRIGSADRLSRGQSTFLVEMAEAASLLNGSTSRSLAILDEIGRGTSTYDGLSIAWAMMEYLHDNGEHRPMVLFATHYHELTSLAARLPLCDNANVKVRETGRKISFLYRVEPGAADRSYGIHVAAMAGVPSAVVKRADRVLADLEKGRHMLPAGGSGENGQMTLPLSNPEHPVLEEIRNIEPDALTPKKALDLIYALKERLDS